MMTTTRICDKCGCEIKDKSSFTHLRAEGRGDYSGYKIIGNSFDLCPDCAMLFLEWLHTKDVKG